MISRTTRATRPSLAVAVPVSRIERSAWILALPPRAARFEATTSSTGEGEEHAARSAARSGSARRYGLMEASRFIAGPPIGMLVGIPDPGGWTGMAGQYTIPDPQPQ